MSKRSVRSQLADALQEIRDLKNHQHAIEQPLRLRVRQLESQNQVLSDRLRSVHLALYAIEAFADGIKGEVTGAASGIANDTRTLASGNRPDGEVLAYTRSPGFSTVL